MHRYALVEEKNGLALLRRDDDRYTVVRVDRDRRQVRDAMPSDAPKGGGVWFAPYTDKGIAYVTSTYSKGYARRVYNRLQALVV